MSQWLIAVTEPVVVIIDAIALLVVVIGTLQALVGIVRLITNRNASNDERRGVWMRYSHWLVAGLTFQLAADIVESSITPDWDGIWRLAAVALIRTFLNYFLERDVEEVRQRQKPALPRAE